MKPRQLVSALSSMQSRKPCSVVATFLRLGIFIFSCQSFSFITFFIVLYLFVYFFLCCPSLGSAVVRTFVLIFLRALGVFDVLVVVWSAVRSIFDH